MNKAKAFIHDHFFKEIFSVHRQGVEILNLVLTEEESSHFDFKRLKVVPGHFINKDSQEKRMDLILSAPFKNSEEWIDISFLMEHKSYKDPGLMLQILSYLFGLFQKKREPVISVLVDQSPDGEWQGVLEFHDYLNRFKGRARELFGKDVLNFRIRVINLQALDIEKLSRALTIRPILYTLKHVRSFNRQNFVRLFEMSPDLKKLACESLIGKAVNYICRYNPDIDPEEVKQIEKETLKKEDRIMESFIDKAVREGKQEALQQGMQQGMEQGVQKVALNMLRENTDIAFISKITKLTETEIKKLKNGS